MFQFGKRVFGRKGLSAFGRGDVGEPSPQGGQGGRDIADASTLDGIMARCAAMALGSRFSADYYLGEAVAALSPEERMALLASILPEMGDAPGYVMSGQKGRPAQLERCYVACMAGEMTARKEHLPTLLAAFVGLERYRSVYAQKHCTRIVQLMRAAIKDGGFFTSADCQALAAFAEELRALSVKQYRKPQQKTLTARAEAVEKLAGVEVSATSVLLDRCEGADNRHALGELPQNYAFWTSLLAATVAGLHDIMRAVKAGGKPGWMTDPAAFAEAFPPVGPIVPRFGDWTRCPSEPTRPFAALEATARLRKGIAQPEDLLALPAQRDVVAPMFRYLWGTPQIPALDVLADLEDAGWTAFAEHLITARSSPRPTKAWLKEGMRLAGAIGIAAVEERLHAWLALFHSPRTTPECLAAATNCHEMDRTAGHLNDKLPDWPALIAAGEIAAAGRALAMQMASGSDACALAPLSIALLKHNDNVYKGKQSTRGMLAIHTTPLMQTNGNRDYGSIRSWLRVSVENEQLLRGVVWMLAEMPGRTAAIAAIEQVVLAAAMRLSMGDDGMRSKVVANAGIATLIDMGGADVDPVLLRLSRDVDDRTVNAALFKAINAS